jgi:hypothetical protein
MNPTGQVEGKPLSTADLAAAGRHPTPEDVVERDDDRAAGERVGEERADERAVERKRAERPPQSSPERPDTTAASEKLEPLFASELARDYRSRWAAVQSGFVDDPKRAVQQGDELVAQMMKSLAESFASERTRLEAQLGQTDDASTENLRVSLRRYRSFFERLLSL